MAPRRDQVLEAAMAVLVESGTHGLTHRRVDARAGVPQGTTANYFPNRLALVTAVVRQIPQLDAEYVDEVADEEATDPEELLLAWMRRRAAFLLGPGRLQPLAWCRFAVDGSSDPEIQKVLADANREIFDGFRSIVTRCGSKEPERHAFMLASFLGGISLRWHILPHKTYDLDQMLIPMARGMAHTMRREVGGADGSA